MWNNSFRHTISQFDEFDFDRYLDCNLDYTIKLTDANGGDSVSGVANAKISFLMKSENCNFQIDGETMLGEWVFFYLEKHYLYDPFFINLEFTITSNLLFFNSDYCLRDKTCLCDKVDKIWQ